MGELSFLTIIVSLAVCSLLVYAVFQYMKVRLTILEQSHKEQALILQQFIEESSTDIHRLYQMKSSSSSSSHNNNNDNDTAAQYGDGYHGSIILEYANANANREYEEKPIAYNEPHMIHLDTAIFQNKRASNLIEISSDSEDTTESEASEASDDSASDDSADGSESSESSESDNESASDDDNSDIVEPEPAVIDELPAPVDPAPEIKMITVDLGTIQEITSSISDDAVKQQAPSSPPIDVLAMLYKKAQQPNTDDDEIVFTLPEMPAPATAAPTNQSISGLSVTELRFLLKEKYKQQPEKHAEIQKMKKAELIQALQ
jgi:hypothetical protein